MQKYQHSILTKTKVKNNILRVYQISEVKNSWYLEAHSFAKELSSKRCTLIQACGILSALSPLKTWNQNKTIAKAFILDNIRAKLHTSTQLNKAITILSLTNPTEQEILTILNGDKTKSFFINIYKPYDIEHVTIDRHALSIALGKKLSNTEFIHTTNNQYTFFAQCYKDLAKELNILPSTLQAVTWVKWRELDKTITKNTQKSLKLTNIRVGG